MVPPWRLLFLRESIHKITDTSLTHNMHTWTQPHTLSVWQCRTPRGCDQTHFCLHWGPAEVSRGSDSSSVMDRVLALVPPLVFEASHISKPCVFLIFGLHAWCEKLREEKVHKVQASLETPVTNGTPLPCSFFPGLATFSQQNWCSPFFPLLKWNPEKS